jgi:tetraacyldisaccharide 4'-kinase
MHEPSFWWRKPGLTSRLLSPFGFAYGAVSGWRMTQPSQSSGVPVVCIGNYHVGGAGKTPLALAVVGLLKELGEHPFVLSRGYAGRLRGPVRVAEHHEAVDVGDEPLLLARAAPVIVARNRLAGAALALQSGASVIVMDDGFQNPSLRKDLSIVVVDGGRALGNEAVFPAGPLRAPLSAQVARTDMLIVVGDGQGAARVASMVAERGKPVLHAHLRPTDASLETLRGRNVLAFAGIGDPERFFATLRASGITVAEQQIFPDHHPFTTEQIEQLILRAEREELMPVTTEKDMARMRGEGMLPYLSRSIVPFAITMEIDERDVLRLALSNTLRRVRSSLADAGVRLPFPNPASQL